MIVVALNHIKIMEWLTTNVISLQQFTCIYCRCHCFFDLDLDLDVVLTNTQSGVSGPGKLTLL